jgi:hypothetical protein
MKIIVNSIVAIVAISAPNAWANYATINLSNHGPLSNPIYYYTGVLLPAEGAYVELRAHVQDSWVPLNSEVEGASYVFPLTEPGFFNSGVAIVPYTAPLETVEFSLRAWSGGSSFELAEKKGSVTWSQQTGSWNPRTPPMTGVELANPPIYFIPEPSTLVLGLLGGAVVMLCRRKKVG